MQLSTRYDVEMPAEALFDMVSDFDRLERMMVRRGAQVTRLEPAAGSPMGWDIAFDWRGRQRDMRMNVTRFDRPESIEMQARSEGFDIDIKADVVALSRQRARLMLGVTIKGRNIKSRLLLQTAKLNRATVDRKFHDRIESFVDGLTEAGGV